MYGKRGVFVQTEHAEPIALPLAHACGEIKLNKHAQKESRGMCVPNQAGIMV